MKLRGIFDPKLYFVVAVVLIALSAWTASSVRGQRVELGSARLDTELLPVGLLLGLGLGVPVGIWRLKAIRRALPEIDGQFFLSEAGVLERFREGQNARTLEQIGYGGAFGIWLILVLSSDGRVVLFGTFVFSILGLYLTGRLLPFARLFLELRSRKSKPASLS